MLTVAISQPNLTAGDILGNADIIINDIERAKQAGAKLLLLPELALSGYLADDLLLRDDFTRCIEKQVLRISEACDNITVVLGAPIKKNQCCYNAAVVIQNQAIIQYYFKQKIPNYGVFDEARHFTAGENACVFSVNDVQFGVVICEDLWSAFPVQQAKNSGAEIIVSLNASPYDTKKHQARMDVLYERQKAIKLPIIYCNLVGGQDELVFDGGSLALNEQGTIAYQAKYFDTDFGILTINNSKTFVQLTNNRLTNKLRDVYQALVLSVKDYIQKNDFKGAILGLSGGIDSALTLAILVDAIGSDRVQAIMLPSRYTSSISLEDAHQQAMTLGVNYKTIPIERVHKAFTDTLNDVYEVPESGITAENIQSRCRGVLLMAISNHTHQLVICTGNKSELAVGYSTLYGDLIGGFAVLKDINKQMVYQLAHYRNCISPTIPERVIERPPSAELAPDQIDENTLPPYTILDEIIERYVELDWSVNKICHDGYDRQVVENVVKMIKSAEYKRRQAPIGPKISPRAFGRERRYPVTTRF